MDIGIYLCIRPELLILITHRFPALGGHSGVQLASGNGLSESLVSILRPLILARLLLHGADVPIHKVELTELLVRKLLHGLCQVAVSLVARDHKIIARGKVVRGGLLQVAAKALEGSSSTAA